jgi:hypothetical protein
MLETHNPAPRRTSVGGWLRTHESVVSSLFIALLGLVYYLSYARQFRIDVDEGLIINGAMRVLSGQIPLRDFHQYMAGHYYPLAFWFLLFGKSILVERLFFVLLHTLKNVLLFRLARRVLPAPWAWLPTLLLLVFPGFWVKGFINLVLIVNLGLIWNYLERPGAKRLIALGLAIGASVYFREDMAGYSVLTAGLILLVDGARRKVKFSAIFKNGLILGGAVLAALIPLITLYVASHGVPDLIRGISETIRLGQVESVDTTLVAGSIPWPPRLTKGYLYYLTPLMLLITGVIIARHWRSFSRGDGLHFVKILAALLLGSFSFYHIWHWHNEFRFPQTGAILLLLWAWLLHLASRPVRSLRLARAAARAAAAFLIVGVLVYYALLGLCGHAMWRYDAASFMIADGPHRPVVRTTRSNILPPTEQAVKLSRLLEYIGRKSTPEDRIFCFGESILYFLSERNNATEFDNGRIPAYFPDQRAKFVAQIRERRPKIIIMRGWEFEWWSAKMPEAFQAIMPDYILDDELFEYYVLLRVEESEADVRQGNALLWRGDARGAAAAYRAALTATPGRPVLIWNLDRLFFLTGLWERAAVSLDGFAVQRDDTDWSWRWGSPNRHAYSGTMTFTDRDDIAHLVSVTPALPGKPKIEWSLDKNRLSFSTEKFEGCAGLDIHLKEKTNPSTIVIETFLDGKPFSALYHQGRGWPGSPDAGRK